MYEKSTFEGSHLNVVSLILSCCSENPRPAMIICHRVTRISFANSKRIKLRIAGTSYDSFSCKRD